MNHRTIEVVLFDLGNVILPFNHYQIAEKLARFSERKELSDPPQIFSYLFNREQGAVNDYETGKMSSVEFFNQVKDRFKLIITFDAFVPIWDEIFTENHDVSELIRSLKGKKKLGLLSNTNPLHFKHALSTYPVLKLFDKWILSHEVGFKKPAVEIFLKAIEWASVPPMGILFVDDIKEHVEVAASLGLQAIHFVSVQQLVRELDRLEINE
jgi:putative hydrolase of the HAD superfamily